MLCNKKGNYMPIIKPFPNFFSNTNIVILQDIQTVTHYLTQKYHAKCYVVGGAVRDRLLGYACKDYDIECFGISVEDFEHAMAYLGAQGVGKSFFVYKYYDLDIALPRKEKKVAKGHRGFEVRLASEEKEASQRRDFTVNALMYDIENEQILDFWNGLEDLKNKLLRVVDEDSFIEDSLRVLRAMQFASRFGFKVEEKSCKLSQKMSLDDLPKERLFTEFEKMFSGQYLHYGLYYLFALGIAQKLFNEEIDRKAFLYLGLQLQRNKKNFLSELRPYYFLFIVGKSLPVKNVLDRLGASNQYYKKIASVPALPSSLSAFFVANRALNEGIIHYVGNYDSKVIRLAKELDVWEKPFDRGVTPIQLLEEGFSGKALGDELERRTAIKINSLKEK